VKAFVEASRRLEDAQRRALAGDEGDADAWRAAAARDREATDAVVEAVRSGAGEAGHPASARALELVGETLRAATGDPELRERVLRGRVEREQSAATLGTLGGEAAPVAPARGSAGKRARGSEKRPEVATARRELKRLERELSSATAREERLGGRVERATEALREEKERLAESKRATAELRRRLRTAERRAAR
jgi:hypothetical protein